jgi:hypothetical protein
MGACCDRPAIAAGSDGDHAACAVALGPGNLGANADDEIKVQVFSLLGGAASSRAGAAIDDGAVQRWR